MQLSIISATYQSTGKMGLVLYLGTAQHENFSRAKLYEQKARYNLHPRSPPKYDKSIQLNW